MRLSSIINFGILIIIMLVIRVILLFNEVSIPTFVNIIFIAFLFLVLLFIIFSPIIRYKRYRYFIDDEKIIVIEGLWFVSKTIAPIERVHQIQIQRGPVDRLFGLSKVVATTAGDNIEIKFLENQIAEEIAESLGLRIGTIVKAQRGDINA